MPSEPAEHVPSTDAREAEFRAKVDLLSALGRSLHQVGLPAHALEDALEETAERCGVPVQVFSMPTGIWMSVQNGDALPAALLIRSDPGAVHLERLTRVTNIARKIAQGTLMPADATRQIDGVMHAPPRWGRFAIVLGYLLSAAAFSVFFGGGIQEVVTGMCVGLATGLWALVFQQGRASRRLFELTSAATAAVIANVVYTLTDHFVEWIPLAAGLIILLPGLALVDAVEELAHGQLTAGAARLAGVSVALLAMTFGAVLGSILVQATAIIPEGGVANPLPEWFLVPALLAVAVGSTIRFRARPEDMGIALVASVIALIGSRWGKAALGEYAGPFVAALALGLTANVFARFFDKPPQLFAVPGLALLVPGSFGVQSMSALLGEDTIVGVDTAFHMVLTAMALVAGLLFSNVVARSRGR